MEDILKINNVSKSFKTFSLENININIKENCITGFLGKNGAGKTTLIKIILGLMHMDEGNIIYFNDLSLKEKEIKDRIGVVLDDGYFYDNLTLILIKVFFSVYIPLTFKLGYIKLQMVSAGIIFISPFLIRLISNNLNNSLSIFLKLNQVSNNLFLGISILTIITIVSISIKATSLILDNKEY